MGVATILRELVRAVKAVRRDADHQLCHSLYTCPQPMTFTKAAYLSLTPELRLTASYRFYNALHRAGHPRLAQLAYLRTKFRFGCDLHPAAEIEAGLRIVHAQDLVIGPDVHLGKDVVLFNGVTLGNKLGREAWLGMPSVGDSVLIGAGAKILGPIRIGTDARIGANAVVLRDVPDRGIAVGVPARIVAVADGENGKNGTRADAVKPS